MEWWKVKTKQKQTKEFFLVSGLCPAWDGHYWGAVSLRNCLIEPIWRIISSQIQVLIVMSGTVGLKGTQPL